MFLSASKHYPETCPNDANLYISRLGYLYHDKFEGK